MIAAIVSRFVVLAVIAALSLAAAVRAQAASPSIYDSFFTFGSPMNSGSGFASGSIWNLGSTSTNATLSYPGLASSGGSVKQPSSTTHRNSLRILPAARQFGANGTKKYVSLLLRPEGTVGGGLSNGYFGLTLVSSSPPNLFIGKNGSLPHRYAVEDAGGNKVFNTLVVPASGRTVLLVLKAEFGAGTGGNDRFTLYMDPVVGGDEPATGGTVKQDSNVSTITGLRIDSTGAFSMDELRVGDTFADVTPAPESTVYEGFEYSDGSSNGLKGGTGFAEEWHLGGISVTQNTNYRVTAEGLGYPNLESTGGRFVATATLSPSLRSGLTRTLLSPFGQPGTIRYISFLIRPEGTLGVGNNGGWFGLCLDSPPEPQLFIGRSGLALDAHYRIEERIGLKPVESSVIPSVGQTVLAVVKAEFAESGNDTFTLHINPTPGEPEPASGVVKNDSNSGLVSALTLYSSGAFSLDELRVGATFAEVTPIPLMVDAQWGTGGSPRVVTFTGILQTSADLLGWTDIISSSPYEIPAEMLTGSRFFRSRR